MSRAILLLACLLSLIPQYLRAQPTDCPARPYPNTPVQNPFDLTSANGVLKVDFSLLSRQMLELPLKVCYVYEATPKTVEAPTLRLNPGDQLDLNLTDRFSYVPPHAAPPAPNPSTHDACAGGPPASTSTNLDFYGLNIPSDCHQGEVTTTAIANTDAPFAYKFQIPKDQPPGMYWYHPFLRGSSTLQLNGGASGVLIVNGIEKVKPEVAGLPERILVVRQQFDADDPDPWPATEFRFSLNFQTVFPAHKQWPVIQMRPGTKEFWRVANATSLSFLALQEVFGKTPQLLKVVALDGVPLRTDQDLHTIKLPPGSRAEFIVTAPLAGQAAHLMLGEFETGPIGSENQPQELAHIVATPDAQAPPAVAASDQGAAPAWHADAALSQTRPSAVRKLYFAEASNGTNGPTKYFLTVEGQTPKLFDASAPPAIVTKVGGVEDWIVANRTGEVHAFHMHGVHFLMLESSGRRLPTPETRDTVTIPAWNGIGPFPTLKLRMDFRDPRTAGTFVFHCDISHHAEAGMMGQIQVNP